MNAAPTTAPVPFGVLLKRLRLRAMLTQEQLAWRSGLSVEAVGALERGSRRHPRRTTLALLADALALGPAEREAFLASRPRPPRGPRQTAARDGLPRPNTPLIGRESELERALALIRSRAVRLLTISGPPGVGKSRLALELAHRSRGDGFDEAAFVSLAPLSDPGLVGSAIALALALPAGSGQLVQRLAERIGSRRVLLVLDDFERLVPAGPMLAEIAARCPELLLLVTSRMSLRVRGEQEFSLQPLRLPDEHEVTSGVLDTVPSVALFVQRARATSLELALTPRSGPVVADICRTLDGLPLALELAAPWVKVFSLEALLAHLRERRLSILVGGAQDLPEHQRTMRDTLRWSYQHLSDAERVLFRRLSIFAGSPSLAAVEAVCRPAGGPDGDLLQLVAGLVDKNLLRRDARAGEPRLGMLETIRAFGREMLEASGDADATERAHAAHYRALVEAADREPSGDGRSRCLASVDRERDDIRAALAWWQRNGDAAGGLVMAACLWQYWELRGHWREGLEWLDHFLRAAGAAEPAARARALHAAGVLAQRLGEHAGAARRLVASLRIHREIGDREGIADALNSLGLVALSRGNPRRATVLFERGLAMCRELGQPRRAAVTRNNLAAAVLHSGDADRAGILLQETLAEQRQQGDARTVAAALCNLGNVARLAGRFEEAAAYLGESLRLCRDAGDASQAAMVLDSCGDLARASGDGERAVAAYRDSLAIRLRLQDPVGTAACLEGLAAAGWMRGELDGAARIYGAAANLRARLCVSPPRAQGGDHERIRADLQRAMGRPRFAAAASAGGAMSLADIARELTDAS